MTIKALAFDAYGTLFDVHSVVETIEEHFPFKGRQLSEIWRTKQLEYTWLVSLMERYESMWELTRSSLVYGLKRLDLPLDEDVMENLMASYLTLQTFPEVPDALRVLRERHRAIFSNGNLDMLRPLVHNTGLSSVLDDVITVEPVRVFKPSMRAYRYAEQQLGVPAEKALFVSSNAFDVAGAKAFGFQVAWVQRGQGQLEELGVTPDHVVASLEEIASLIE